MALHIFPVTIRTVSPPIHGLLSRPTPEHRTVPTVLFYHGLNGSRNQVFQEQYKELAEAIQSIGCNLLAIDLRAHGDRREKKETTAIDNMAKILSDPEKNPFDGSVLDSRKLLEYVIEKKIAPPGEIGICGVSWGALHALYALKNEKRLRCCAALLPVGKIVHMIEFRRMRNNALIQKYEPLTYLEKLTPRPLLMITGENDTRIDPRFAGELYEKLYPEYLKSGVPEQIKYRMLLGTGHAYSPQMTPYIVEWFKEHLLVKKEGPVLD